jgi:hypothetical protein
VRRPFRADVPARRGVVRLLNTAGGRALCLAGEVDAATVEEFWRRYGREPAPIDVIDTRSATRLSPLARELVAEHERAAERAGRPVTLRRVTPGWPAPSPAPRPR